MELHQKTWLEKRSFVLLPNKLKLYLKDVQGEYENYISYEKIKGEAQIRSRKNQKLFLITLVSTSFTICILLQSVMLKSGFRHAIFPSIVALLFAILYHVKKEDHIVVETVDRQRIIFLRNKPNRKALEVFLHQLWLQRNQYLRKKYFYISQSQDVQQQTERLRWLLEEKVITKTEFKFAKDDWVIYKSCQSH
jgi:hypothetical protein